MKYQIWSLINILIDRYHQSVFKTIHCLKKYLLEYPSANATAQKCRAMNSKQTFHWSCDFIFYIYTININGCPWHFTNAERKLVLWGLDSTYRWHNRINSESNRFESKWDVPCNIINMKVNRYTVTYDLDKLQANYCYLRTSNDIEFIAAAFQDNFTKTKQDKKFLN